MQHLIMIKFFILQVADSLSKLMFQGNWSSVACI